MHRTQHLPSQASHTPANVWQRTGQSRVLRAGSGAPQWPAPGPAARSRCRRCRDTGPRPVWGGTACQGRSASTTETECRGSRTKGQAAGMEVTWAQKITTQHQVSTTPSVEGAASAAVTVSHLFQQSSLPDVVRRCLCCCHVPALGVVQHICRLEHCEHQPSRPVTPRHPPATQRMQTAKQHREIHRHKDMLWCNKSNTLSLNTPAAIASSSACTTALPPWSMWQPTHTSSLSPSLVGRLPLGSTAAARASTAPVTAAM